MTMTQNVEQHIRTDLALQEGFLSRVQPILESDEHVSAAWLEGSLGRGNADRWSDIDLHLWLRNESLASFREEAEAWVNRLAPTVLFRLMFDGRMINALTTDGLRLDVWLHGGETPPSLRPGAARVLYDPEQALQTVEATQRDPQELAGWLENQIKEFWRCVALAPSVWGRSERIVAMFGLSLESHLLCDIYIAGHGIERDSGVKRLNEFLPAQIRERVEAALCVDGCAEATLAEINLALARIMQEEGPRLAVMHGFLYPQDLEDAVMAYVRQEMGYLEL